MREKVATCPKYCWLVGTAAPVMKKFIKHPTQWVVKNKLKSVLGKSICIDHGPYYDVGQDPRQGDLRGGDAQQQQQNIEPYRLSESELKDMLIVD
ncbi:hypothetical protein [Thiorhodovibrio litoralis]|uniref:hypothetical protein n=1 Tax=Thiorhodovibrio litoralis TaxID=2952932 RepID=UPI002B25B691|nr:hypothetical protein [Thiorhodovibrio litoralis]WPL11542.1 hypothetical protein Thiosp_01291 [Thiorhodovibrio litoralis]